ncbi:MAG: transcriptional repressor NrdR [Nevskiaceae bacterium]|nr:MAG: transcriptional repressor NrdR [Nevskiaceae bacterium]TBR74733.1 MAG: transcriptional repressor NrdR [Nevskiaceae bacterium]
MQCPFCKCADTRVVDSRLYADGAEVRRRRECPACHRRFTTHERAELELPFVQKNGGAHEPFSEAKLRDGIERALYKRPVSTEAVDRAVEELVERISTHGDREVPTRLIGEWVMESLRDLDQVAYVRFASVYRKFEDVNAFRDVIERLERVPTPAQRKTQLSFSDLVPDPLPPTKP